MSRAASIGGLRGLHSGQALVASGLGLLEGGVGGKTLGAQRLLPVVIEVGPLQAGFGGSELRLGLFGRAFLRGDLPADPVDGGLLGIDLGARGVHRDLVVAVVDLEDHFAGVDQRVVVREDRREMSGHPRAEHGVVGPHIGVVGRDKKPSDQNPVHAIGDRREREQRHDAHEDHLAFARLRRGRHGGSHLRRGPGDRGPLRRLQGAASGGVFRKMRTNGVFDVRLSLRRGFTLGRRSAQGEGYARPGLSLRP